MQRFPFVCFLMAVTLVSWPTAASRADRIAPPAPLDRLATSDCVVIGRVTTLEEKLVEARPGPDSKDKVSYQVAIVQVSDAVGSAKGLTHIKVGYIPVPANPKRGFGGVNLAEGQEVILYLQPHHEAAFHVIPSYFCITDKKNGDYENELALIKKAAKLLDEPVKGLKSKDESDRYRTAAMLIARYRSYRPGLSNQFESIDAEESKLILGVLADTDWTRSEPELWNLSPLNVFYRLGITQKDGWTVPNDPKEVVPAAKKWLKEHTDSFRIQRYAAAKEKK